MMECLPQLCSAATHTLKDASVSPMNRGPLAVCVFISRKYIYIDVQSSLRPLGDVRVRIWPCWGYSGSPSPLQASDSRSTKEKGMGN